HGRTTGAEATTPPISPRSIRDNTLNGLAPHSPLVTHPIPASIPQKTVSKVSADSLILPPSSGLPSSTSSLSPSNIPSSSSHHVNTNNTPTDQQQQHISIHNTSSSKIITTSSPSLQSKFPTTHSGAVPKPDHTISSSSSSSSFSSGDGKKDKHCASQHPHHDIAVPLVPPKGKRGSDSSSDREKELLA
ncbi:hypothetical protein ADUPG1_003582, partial [Aduncisulcus paluster]